MKSTSQSIFPKHEWEHVNVYASPKVLGNCVGIQFTSVGGDYSLCVNTGEGTPKELVRKLHVAFTDLYMKVIEEETK